MKEMVWAHKRGSEQKKGTVRKRKEGNEIKHDVEGGKFPKDRSPSTREELARGKGLEHEREPAPEPKNIKRKKTSKMRPNAVSIKRSWSRKKRPAEDHSNASQQIATLKTGDREKTEVGEKGKGKFRVESVGYIGRKQRNFWS